MSRRNQSEDEVGAIDLTPMLDVVFIMLIFFIVTATFIKEPGVEVNRPDANTALVKNAKILIAVDNDDKIWIDKNEVDIQFIGDQLELLQAENPKSALIIQADAKSSIKMLKEIANAAREIGMIDVSIAANKE